MAEHREHRYAARTVWTGAADGPTESYESYSRAYEVRAGNKPPLAGSADPGFRGDAARWNPEDMLVGALSACHMLWYLHLCAVKGVRVLAYEDDAEGTMVEAPRSGRFTEVVLRPRVTISADSDAERARALHERAHAECFIANSVRFPVRCEPTIETAEADAA